ncbi:Alpha/Beta hydrolase protein [Ilyonectria robusta]|uniref:Alpha/Beta hydrolase protein n=1 Tax=Ilyonectria robusta TaxID=1079257 RepID=UPI001E8D0E2A|nr:Alpha/Beta hydrolase protein [Ilyonectria robusta]KAH8686282.1 Alpha/Beta hydrolase protein [Ilyonectria robusta]
MALALCILVRSTLASARILSTPPHPIAHDAKLTEFRVNISNKEIHELNDHLKLFRAPHPTYENSDNGWKYGVPKDWLIYAVDYWRHEFDWRKQEREINSIPQFRLDLKDDNGEEYSVHFAALFSAKKDAIPIILSHGFQGKRTYYPDSYMIYMPILQRVQKQYSGKPHELTYHLIVPSLIGMGFSSPPPRTEAFYTSDTARILNKLMVALGFGEKGYIAQGQDVGSMVSDYMLEYDECKAAHVTLWWGHPAYDPATDLPSSDLEKYGLQRMAETRQWGQANVLLHSDRSSTAGLTIGGNPISMLVWIGERMVLWSDPKKPLSLETIVATASLYWFTQTYPTSYWIYAAFRSEPIALPTRTGKPEGFSWFPNDVGLPPKSYFERNSDVFTYFYQHDKGGHFSPTEQPVTLWGDIMDFTSKVRKAE